MKTYIVYVNGVEQKELIKAGSHNAAEKKAQKKYGDTRKALFYDGPKVEVSVAYTEV
jgi:hypothetical protein